MALLGHALGQSACRDWLGFIELKVNKMDFDPRLGPGPSGPMYLALLTVSLVIRTKKIYVPCFSCGPVGIIAQFNFIYSYVIEYIEYIEMANGYNQISIIHINSYSRGMFLCGAPECFISYLLSGYTKRDLWPNEATINYLLMGGASSSAIGEEEKKKMRF